MKLNFKCLNCDFSSSIVNFEIVGYSLEDMEKMQSNMMECPICKNRIYFTRENCSITD